MIALVVFIAIKPPGAADNYERTDAIVPKIAEIVKAEVRSRICAFEPNVIVNDQLRQVKVPLDRCARLAGISRTGMVTERPNFPFRVDDRAIVWRQLGFWNVSHKHRYLTEVDQASPRLSSERFKEI